MTEENKKVEARKIIKNNSTGEFEVLKPYSSDFFPHGRKYSGRSISTLYHQNIFHPQYDLTFEPPQLENEIKELVRKHITQKSSKLEQIA